MSVTAITAIIIASVAVLTMLASGGAWLGRKLTGVTKTLTVQDQALAQILRVIVPDGSPSLVAEVARIDAEQKATAKLVDRLLPAGA